MTCTIRMILLIWIGSLIPFSVLHAQDDPDTLSTLRDHALNVFLDFNRGDQVYMRTEVNYVNYVRDWTQADVHVLVTTQRTGSDGREYTFTFIGQKNYADLHDTLIFVSGQMDTDVEIREGYTRILQMGLMRYVARTPLASQININYARQEQQLRTQVNDRWDFWVFRINMSTWLRGEQRSSEVNLNGFLSANRVTLDWKTRLSVNGSYNEDNATRSDGSKINVTRQFREFRGLQVKSLGDHWSVGVSGRVSSSTFNNRKLSLRVTPALEYNYFPYVETTRHELRVLYEIGADYVEYETITIFDETEQVLYGEQLSIIWENRQRWGSVEAVLEGSHFFHDFSFYRIQLFSELELRLFGGFSLRLFGRVERIKDQISLAKDAGLDDSEVLLRRRELQTPYRYFANIGLSYTFGSLFTNIVNPRLGR